MSIEGIDPETARRIMDEFERHLFSLKSDEPATAAWLAEQRFQMAERSRAFITLLRRCRS